MEEPRPRLLNMDEHECQYYLRLVVLDRPGVLARVAGILGGLQISIASVIQMDMDSRIAGPAKEDWS